MLDLNPLNVSMIITAPVVDNAFKISVNTENLGGSGSATKTFVLPAVGGPFDITDWGDGSSDLAVSGSQTHVYSATGTYTITINKITNNFRPCQFNDGGDELKIIDIENWGNIVWDTGSEIFRGCTNLDISATDNPDFSAITTMWAAFYNCTSITRHCTYNAPLCANWSYSFYGNMMTTLPLPDTSANTTFQAIFTKCYDLTSVPKLVFPSGITNFASFFQECKSITSYHSEWDFSSGELFDYAFYFNESCTSYPSEWDFSSVTGARAMFRSNILITSFPSEWDFSSVTNAKEMFRDCTSLTSLTAYSFNSTTFELLCYGNSAMANIPNFPTSGQVDNFKNAFRNMGSVDMPSFTLNMTAMTNGTTCFSGSTLATAAYQLLIIDLNTNNSNTGVTFHGGYSTLDGDATAEAARTNLVDVKSWTITDGD